MVATAAGASKSTSSGTGAGKVALYAGVGPELTHYDVDVPGAALIKRGSVTLPANVQYVWQHISRQYLYAASSNRGPGSHGAPGNTHHLTVFRVDSASGALQAHGAPLPLAHRPIHLTTDVPCEHVLIAYNNPSTVSVHRINRDASVGDELKQPEPLDTGIFAHQIRVTPSNRLAILVTRGYDAAGTKAEDPGGLKVFNYRDGVLTNRVSIAPGGGYGFGPRHLDFHPSQPWVYVSLERQNRLELFKLDGDTLSATALFSKSLLAEPGNVRPRQLGGTVHVHPNGRYVYGANRADSTTMIEGKEVFVGGENSIPVFAIDQSSGEPNLIQHMDSHGPHPRCFSIDPSGRILVVGNKSPLPVREGNGMRTVPASLAVFRIGGDGRLEFARNYEIDVGGKDMFWMGMVPL